jgi:glycosyltransferase involved in cell wall biosynthesis
VAKPGILFVTPWLLAGGIERTLQVTLPWFRTQGYPVQCVAWHVADRLTGQPNPTLAVFREHGVPVRRLPAGRRLAILRHAARVAALAARGDYRIVVGHELVANVVVLLAKLFTAGRVRAIVQFHNESDTYTTTGASRGLLRLARRLYPLADGAVAVSDHLRRGHARFFGLDARTIRTVHNPFPLVRIGALAEEPAPGVDALRPFIVGAGRLAEIKGFPDLIAAFSRVRRRLDARLVILGDGPDRDRLLRCAAERGVAGDVSLPGFATNPYTYFARAHCFVLSSRSEGLANVVVEAMACGAPIVASRCGGAEEVIEHGRTGLLYDVGDIGGLAGALEVVLTEPARAAALAAAARERATRFSAERTLPRLEACYLGRPEPATSPGLQIGAHQSP